MAVGVERTQHHVIRRVLKRISRGGAHRRHQPVLVRLQHVGAPLLALQSAGHIQGADQPIDQYARDLRVMPVRRALAGSPAKERRRTQRELHAVQHDRASHLRGRDEFVRDTSNRRRGDRRQLLRPFRRVGLHLLLNEGKRGRHFLPVDLKLALKGIVLDAGIIEDLGPTIHRVPYHRLLGRRIAIESLPGAHQIWGVTAALEESPRPASAGRSRIA